MGREPASILFVVRYLGIDLGEKRTGLAVGDDQLRLAVPLDVIEIPASRDAGNALLAAIERAIADHLAGPPAAGEVVVGLPVNMDGGEGPAAKNARKVAGELAARTARVIHLRDERLTTAAADWSMARSGLTHKQKKERRDAIAAAAMLQGFLDALPPQPTSAG